MVVAIALTAFACVQRVSFPFLATAAWAAGLACLWLAASTRPRRETAITRSAVGPALPHTVERLLLAIILLVAIAFRFAMLDTVPALLVNDEAMFVRETSWRPGTESYFGEDLVQAWPPGWFPYLFGVGWNGFASFSYFLHWLPVTVLGFSNWSLRCGSAFIGVLGVVGVYVWARRWWGPVVGLCAAFALSLNTEHLFWSRIALNNIDVALLAACALAALAWVIDSRRPEAWVALGVALGAGFYTYHSAKLHLPLVVVVLFMLGATRRYSFSRRDVGGVLTAMLAVALTVAPLIPDIISYWPHWYVQNTNPLQSGAIRAAIHSGDVNWLRAYVYGNTILSTRPMRLAPVMSTLIAIGMVTAIWKWRDPRYLTALIWTAVVFVLGSMTTGWRSARLIGLTPVVSVMAAFAIGHAYAITQRQSRWLSRGASVVGAILFVALLYEAFWVEFVWRAQFRSETFGVCQVIERTTLPATFVVIGRFTPDSLPPAEMLPVCAFPPDVRRRFVNVTDLADLPALVDGHEVVAFVFPDGRHELNRLRQMYPEAAVEPFTLNGPDFYAGAMPGLYYLGARRRGSVTFHVVRLRSEGPAPRFFPPTEVCNWCPGWFGLSVMPARRGSNRN